MHPVEEPVNHRRKDNGNCCKQRDPTVQGIERREPLGGVIRQWINRPHAAKYHARVQESVDQAQMREVNIAPRSNSQAEPYESKCCRQEFQLPQREQTRMCKRLFTMFQFHRGEARCGSTVGG